MGVDPMGLYIQKKVYMLAMALVLVGSVNWFSIGIANFDIIRAVLPLRFARIVYVVVGLAALVLSLRRDVYLPFLGETLLPAAALAPKTPQGANQQVTITTKPHAKVLYWSTEPNPNQGSELPSWDLAYSGYENSGVVTADERGKALLRFRGPPQPYKVPFKGRLEPHIHFRVAEHNGFMGRVQTLFVADGAVEGFADML